MAKTEREGPARFFLSPPGEAPGRAAAPQNRGYACPPERLDQLDGKLDDLLVGLSKYAKQEFVRDDQIGCRQALPWGPVRLVRHLWDQMQLGEIVATLFQSRRPRFDVAETAFVLLANRLCEPCREPGLARWLEHTFVCRSHPYPDQ